MEHVWKSSLWIAIYISTTKNTIDQQYTEGEGEGSCSVNFY